MSLHLLIDPNLLTSPADGDPSKMTEFWSRLVDWVTDPRVKVGTATHAYAYSHYAQYGYPEATLHVHPPAMRPSYVRALNTLMSRVVTGDQQQQARALVPPHGGTPQAQKALAADVGAACDLVIGIATSVETWAQPAHEVLCVPSPPASLALCFAPNAEVGAELRLKAQQFYKGRAVHIVGGQVDMSLVAQLERDFNLAGRVDWIPSEKNKPPRNLDKRWGGFDPAKDITICITGRIGHAASGKAASVCLARGVPHLKIESANELAGVLLLHAQDNSPSAVAVPED